MANFIGRPGEKHHNAKLTEEDVRKIRQVYRKGQPPTQAELASQYNVTREQISQIVNRLYWRHI